MANWKKTIHLKDLLNESEEWEEVKRIMASIADRVEASRLFPGFDLTPFRNVPEGDDVITPSDYANKLLNRLYDYADEALIWIE